MTDQDNMREHLATTIEVAIREWHTHDCPCSKVEHVAQAVIDDLGLHVEGQMGADGDDPIWEERVVGKWESS